MTLAKSPIKKIMKEASGGKNVSPDALDKMIEMVVDYVKDTAAQASKFAENAKRKTLMLRDIESIRSAPVEKTPAAEPVSEPSTEASEETSEESEERPAPVAE